MNNKKILIAAGSFVIATIVGAVFILRTPGTPVASDGHTDHGHEAGAVPAADGDTDHTHDQ